MAEQTTGPIKVVLRWVQILDTLDPAYEEKGEFRFTARVTDGSGTVHETRMPEEGRYPISDHPAWRKKGLDQVIFEGEPGAELTVELIGEELDRLTPNEQLDSYRRVFEGPADRWIGRYSPDAEGPADPETMSNWRVCYDIERG